MSKFRKSTLLCASLCFLMNQKKFEYIAVFFLIWVVFISINRITHCVKSVRIWSFSCPYFPALRLNMERYTEYFSVFRPNTEKYGPVKSRIWILFTQRQRLSNLHWISLNWMFVSSHEKQYHINIQKQLLEVCYRKRWSQKIRKLHRKTSVSESLFNKLAGLACNFIKKDALALVFSGEFCEFSKNSFFTTECLWATDLEWIISFVSYINHHHMIHR